MKILKLIALACLAFLYACSTTSTSSGFASINAANLETIKGASTEALIDTLGDPKKIEHNIGGSESSEAWYYESTTSQTDLTGTNEHSVLQSNSVTTILRVLIENDQVVAWSWDSRSSHDVFR